MRLVAVVSTIIWTSLLSPIFLLCFPTTVIASLDGNLAVTAFLGGTRGYTNGVGTNVYFNQPRSVTISPDGEYALVSDTYNNVIRHVILSTATVTTLAGNLTLTDGSANGVGTSSSFYSPGPLDISPDGLYALVVDTDNSLIRKINISTLIVTTLAGSSADSADGVGTYSGFNYPLGLCISPDGSFALVADTNSNLIRMIDLDSATVTTLAGDLTFAFGSSDGVGTSGPSFFAPAGLSISGDGSYVLVADRANYLIRKIIISTADVTTLAGVAGTYGSINGAGTSSFFNDPYDVIISPDDSYALVADNDFTGSVRRIDLGTEMVTTPASGLSSATGLSISPDGNYALVVDLLDNTIKKLTSASSPTLFPTRMPTTQPTRNPSRLPTQPTFMPTEATSEPTTQPTLSPSRLPTQPTFMPTEATSEPTTQPTVSPSRLPTQPTFNPTMAPTLQPTPSPPGRYSFGVMFGDVSILSAGKAVLLDYFASDRQGLL
jgi:DNA-binding beta-propeller fold protein YncE